MAESLISRVKALPLTQRLSAHWKSNRLTRAIATMAGGNMLAQAISLLVTPATTRIYSPADYGVAAVFTSLIGVLAIIATFRYEMAILLPREEDDAREVLAVCVALAFLSTGVVALLTWLFGQSVFTLFRAPELYRYWWMVPAGLLGAALYQSYSSWVLRRKAYKLLTGTRLQQAVGASAVTIGVGFMAKGPLGLLLGVFASNTLGVGRLSRGVKLRRESGDSKLHTARVTASMRSYAGFASLATGAAVLNSTGLLAPPLLFAALYTQEFVGSFSLAQRVVLLPGTLVGAAVAQVFLAEAGEIMRHRPTELASFFKSVTKKTMLFAACPVVLGAMCPLVFPLAFGARWHAAGILASLLAISAAAYMAVAPLAGISTIVKRQDIQLFLDAIRTVVVFGAICIPAHYGCSGTIAVLCYAIGMMLVYVFNYFVYARMVHNITRAAEQQAANAAVGQVSVT